MSQVFLLIQTRTTSERQATYMRGVFSSQQKAIDYMSLHYPSMQRLDRNTPQWESIDPTSYLGPVSVLFYIRALDIDHSTMTMISSGQHDTWN